MRNKLSWSKKSMVDLWYPHNIQTNDLNDLSVVKILKSHPEIHIHSPIKMVLSLSSKGVNNYSEKTALAICNKVFQISSIEMNSWKFITEEMLSWDICAGLRWSFPHFSPVALRLKHPFPTLALELPCESKCK